MTWSKGVMERFEHDLSRLAVRGNVKARVVFRDVALASSLDEKQDKVAAWQSLAASMLTPNRAAGRAQDVPSWRELSAFLDTWCATHGAPADRDE